MLQVQGMGETISHFPLTLEAWGDEASDKVLRFHALILLDTSDIRKTRDLVASPFLWRQVACALYTASGI